jgi:anti-sigma factor RsiW
MDCKEARRWIDCYADGELDAPRTLDVEGHLEICAVCAHELEGRRSLRRVLANPDLYAQAGRSVSRQVRLALRRSAAETTTSRPVIAWWRWAAVCAVALGIAAIAVFLTKDVFVQRDTLVAEVTSAHVRSLLADHLMDVASEDRHTVKPWFAGKLDFAPPVKDLADAGFVLVGGRMDYVNHRPVAALVYRHQQHIVNVFAWPGGGRKASPKSLAQDGFNVVRWMGAQMEYWAVSDLNRAELEKLPPLLAE